MPSPASDTPRLRMERVAFGGDYNPEQWPAEVRAEDMRLMKQASVDLVSVGIFSWALVEPDPGHYDFSWFDDVMDDLATNGIGASLATMTASPPPWLAHLHPETLPVTADGTTLWPGGRQHYCPSSLIYRDAARRLVEQLARRYADHPALRLWHVGNEYGVQVARCYCDVSAADFRGWLRNRYGDVAALNDAWSTMFWSQRYRAFEEVLPPRSAPSFANPAQQLDFARFSSDAMLACYRTETDVLRRLTPDVPVTTNFLGMSEQLDGWAWAPHVDVVSYDSYPDPHDDLAYVDAAIAYDLMRSLHHGAPWLLMEQAPSAVNWRARNGGKEPGKMRLDSWQAVARGADAVMFFQWRQSRGGAEKYHSGMVPHAGPDSRIFREVAELGSEISRVPSVVGSRVTAEVAIVFDWPSWWGLELDSHPSAEVTMREAIRDLYAPLLELGIACDLVPPTADLSAYRLVLAPRLYLVTGDAARHFSDYVERGGTLLTTYFSGVVDECDRVHPGGAPGPLRGVVGASVEEWWPLRPDQRIGIAGDLFDQPVTAGVWAESLRLDGAESVASFSGGFLDGSPAVLRHRVGQGTSWYVGTQLAPSAMQALLARVIADTGVEPVLPGLPPRVEAVRRVNDAADEHLFLLNHADESRTVPIPTPMTDLLTGAVARTDVVLPRLGVAILRPTD